MGLIRDFIAARTKKTVCPTCTAEIEAFPNVMRTMTFVIPHTEQYVRNGHVYNRKGEIFHSLEARKVKTPDGPRYRLQSWDVDNRLHTKEDAIRYLKSYESAFMNLTRIYRDEANTENYFGRYIETPAAVTAKATPAPQQ